MGKIKKAEEDCARKFSNHLMSIARLSLMPANYENLNKIEIELYFNSRNNCTYTINRGVIGSIFGGKWERGSIRYKELTQDRMNKEARYIEFALTEHFGKKVTISHNFTD